MIYSLSMRKNSFYATLFSRSSLFNSRDCMLAVCVEQRARRRALARSTLAHGLRRRESGSISFSEGAHESKTSRFLLLTSPCQCQITKVGDQEIDCSVASCEELRRCSSAKWARSAQETTRNSSRKCAEATFNAHAPACRLALQCLSYCARSMHTQSLSAPVRRGVYTQIVYRPENA